MEFKYKPSDFPQWLREDMEKAYDAYRKKEAWAMSVAVDDVHHSAKKAWKEHLLSFDEMKEMQIYFWGLLDEFE